MSIATGDIDSGAKWKQIGPFAVVAERTTDNSCGLGHVDVEWSLEIEPGRIEVDTEDDGSKYTAFARAGFGPSLDITAMNDGSARVSIGFRVGTHYVGLSTTHWRIW
jgi:hypothetical protein